MIPNRISTPIPAQVIADVTAALTQVKTLLAPYMQTLTEKERQELPKMSNKTLSFVAKTVDYCKTNPEFCPSYLSVPDLNIDFSTVAVLNPIVGLCEQICSNLSDTEMLAGNEAYIAALQYYGGVQAAAKSAQPDAKPIYDDLRERFMPKSKRKETPVVI